MMSKLTLLLLFSFSLLNLQAQDWELIYQENFGTGYTGQPLPSNWESNIFNGSTLGATGGADDPCQSSLLRFYSAYLAYQMNLSDTYEYYVSMNVKTDDPAGAELIFYHNTIAEASGTVIGAPATVPTIPSNQPGQVISSAIFSDLDGAHYFIIAKGPNDPSSGDERTRIDDFKLYRRPVGGTNEVPAVTLTQPTDGASFEENETIVLAATATDSDGSIQSVQFYQDQTLLLEDFNAPYEATITNGLAAGSYTLKAIATDNEGATGETTINITIDPTDTGGGGNPSDWELIYEENFGTGYTGQPLPTNWEDNIFNGSTQGATGGDDDPCRSSLLRFYSAYLAYQMDLSDTYEYYVSMNLKTDDPAGAELIFYHNTVAEASGTTIGDPIAVPTIPANQPGQVMSSAIFGDLNGAHYFIIAKGPNDPSSGDERTRIDDFKLYRRPVGGTNEAPILSLTQPIDAASFEENETIAIAATASDPDGTIQSVQFYEGQTLLAEDFTAPYETTIANGLAVGSYTLKAIATDNEGATAETTITVTIDPTDTGGGGNPSDWELIYEENFGTGYTGQPLPANWEDNIFNGTTQGATGGDDDPCQSSLLRFYSAYLAYQMDLSDTYEYYVSMNLKTDDPAGAELIFYHNTVAEASGTTIGDPIAVPTIPANQPGQVMSSAIFGDLNGAHYFIIGKGPNDPSSGDERTRIDDFKLYRRPVGGANEVPTVTLTAPADGATFEENENIAISATASDSDGTVQSVQFYYDQTLISEVFSEPYQTALGGGLIAGTYTLRAVATDNGGATSEDQINITVTATPPVLPSIAFETSSLSVEEGTSVEVCLSISEAPEQAVSMEVAVSGNASPHFDDYTTTTINFPTGSTSNQCFTLNTDPIDQVLSGEINYSFVLQTPVGSEIGTVNQLTVNVSDQSTQVLSTISFVTATASLTAGEDLQVCLSISEAPSASASVEVAISGNSAPHFSSFATTTVQFPIGETGNQCFNLSSLLAPEVTESTNYTFVLQNPVAAELSTSNNLVLTVNPAATGVDCPYAGPDQTICAGETITIGCPDDPNDPSPYCFKWEPEIGFVEEFGSTQPNPTIQPEETTTYTLYVTDGNGSLIAEEEMLVTVSGEMPQVEILMCEASPVQLTVIVEGENNLTYEWDNGSTETSIQAAFSGTYSVTVTNESSCQAIASIEVPEVIDPAQNAHKIKEYFKNKGFFALPIDITGDDDSPVLVNSPNPNARNSDPAIIDHAEKLIKVKEEESFNVASIIYEFLQDEFYTDFADRKAYITKNENFCESVSETDNTRLIDETETNFLREEFAYWIHVWENPEEGGKDCLLIAAMSPNVEGISPANSSKVDYLTNLLGIIEGESTTYGYVSKGKQMLSVAFDNLADFYEADLTMDFLDQGQGTPTDPDDPLGGGPCGVQVTSELVCLNSAGFPITIPVGYTPYWAKSENLRGNFDPKALVAFSGDDGYYVGYKGTNRQTGQTYHTGFKNQKAPNNKYTFPDLSNECRAIYFGTVTDFSAIGQESCSNINASPEAYKTTLNLIGNTERTGIHQADFEAIKDVSNSNCDISNATSYVYNSCIPHISKAAFDKAKHTAVFNPFGANSSLKGGILFRYEIKETIGNEEVVTGEKWIFGHFTSLDPAHFTYFIWSCEQGRWQDYTPVEAEVEDMPFLAALFGAMLETFDPDTWRDLEIGSQAWHTALDALGFFPVIGSVADFINGVWYISEGNLLEGIPTLVGAIPLGGDFYQLVRLGIGDASKYALKVNINGVETVLDSKSLGRYKCLTSIGFNSTNLSINSALSSFLFFPPDCNGTNSFKNNFDPSGLLSKAAKEGATELTEAATKELIDWLAIAVKEDVFIGKAFEKYPDLIKVWKQTDFSAFPDENKRELLSWLGKMDAAKADEWAVVDKFLEKPQLVKAWKGAIDFPNVKKDIAFLESFLKAMNDATLAGPPINIETRFKDWIQNAHLKCRTCANGSEPFLDDVLNNLYDFKALLSKPGAIKVIDDIGKSTRGAEGANWAMRFTKERGISPSAFEEIITDGRKFTADIVEGSGSSLRYFECKSWDSSMKGLFIRGNTNFGAQFTNYLHNTNIQNLSQFGYHFNPAKWTPNALELNSALKASSNLFKSDITTWAKYRQLFGPEIDNIIRGDFDGLIDIITNSHFSKIVNPS